MSASAKAATSKRHLHLLLLWQDASTNSSSDISRHSARTSSSAVRAVCACLHSVLILQLRLLALGISGEWKAWIYLREVDVLEVFDRAADTEASDVS